VNGPEIKVDCQNSEKNSRDKTTDADPHVDRVVGPVNPRRTSEISLLLAAFFFVSIHCFLLRVRGPFPTAH
jgi:hypothetical protein